MESVDYCEDAQSNSLVEFDDSMDVEKFLCDLGVVAMETVEERIISSKEVEADVRVKEESATSIKTTKFPLDFDLNKPYVEETQLATKFKGERDFDLNKFPIVGMYHFDDPGYEPMFIEILQILLPDHY